jgi:hypothetical protein
LLFSTAADDLADGKEIAKAAEAAVPHLGERAVQTSKT